MATGWTLQFLPAGDNDSQQIERRLRDDGNCCWFHAVEDDQLCLGFLTLNIPDSPEMDRSFLAVCDLAEMTAELACKTMTATRALESRTNEVATLVEIGLSIPNEKDLLGALNQLLRAAVQLTAFRSAGFFLLEPTGRCLNLRASSQLEPYEVPFRSRELADQPPDLEAMSDGRVILLSDPTTRASNWLPDGYSTGVCVAIPSESSPLGTLWVFDRRRREPTDRELHVLHSIAAQVAAVLERVVLLRESAVQQRLQQDLLVASEAQMQDVVGALESDCGFEAAAVCTSRHEIGGDLCELIPLGNGRTIVAVGDASGDSIPAALVMSAVRGALRSLSIDCGEDVFCTDVVMERINRALYSITPPHQFMSLIYGVVDARQKTFTYTNAGHPAPLLVRSAQVQTLKSHGMLLGVTSDATYERSVLSLEPKDVLVGFSDGISEAMSLGRRMFRSDGIASVVKRHETASPASILQAIWSELESHLQGGDEPDDRTLLILRMAG